MSAVCQHCGNQPYLLSRSKDRVFNLILGFTLVGEKSLERSSAESLFRSSLIIYTRFAYIYRAIIAPFLFHSIKRIPGYYLQEQYKTHKYKKPLNILDILI